MPAGSSGLPSREGIGARGYWQVFKTAAHSGTVGLHHCAAAERLGPERSRFVMPVTNPPDSPFTENELRAAYALVLDPELPAATEPVSLAMGSPRLPRFSGPGSA